MILRVQRHGNSYLHAPAARAHYTLLRNRFYSAVPGHCGCTNANIVRHAILRKGWLRFLWEDVLWGSGGVSCDEMEAMLDITVVHTQRYVRSLRIC